MGITVTLSLIDLSIFDQQLAPAYFRYADSSDTSWLVALTKAAVADYTVAAGNVPDLPSLDVYQEYLDILTGKAFYSADGAPQDQLRGTSPSDLKILIDSSIAPDLMRLVCIPHDLQTVEQNMSHRQLMTYLYRHSLLVEKYFTFAAEPTGRIPLVKLGEWSRFFSSEEIRQLHGELAHIPRPEERDVLDGGFDNLRALLQAANTRSDLGLLMTVL